MSVPASKQAARSPPPPADVPNDVLALISGMANDPKSTIAISKGFAEGTVAHVAKDEQGKPRFNAEQAWAFILAAVLRRNVAMLGGGGVGKTHVGKAMIKELKKSLGADALCVCAPTGAAARLIGGVTVHRALPVRLGTGW